MKRSGSVLTCAFWLCGLLALRGQGTFQNLNFEDATIVPIGSPPYVVASSAIPGWTAYIGNTTVSSIAYNTVAIGSPMVSIHDSASSIFQPLQGSYAVALQHSVGGTPSTAAIGRTGQLPLNTVSIIFSASGSLISSLSSLTQLQVTFAGNAIPLIELGTVSGWSVLGGDLSVYAGQTGELCFTALPTYGAITLDNIQFSTSPIPEPSLVWLLLVGGGVLLSLRYPRRSCKRFYNSMTEVRAKTTKTCSRTFSSSPRPAMAGGEGVVAAPPCPA
jgi:hypothetical protein